MAKGKLEFDLNEPEDAKEFQMAVNASNAYAAIFEVGQQVFRPARKHGYPDPTINNLLNKIGDDGYELVGLLEEAFYKIVADYKADMDY